MNPVPTGTRIEQRPRPQRTVLPPTLSAGPRPRRPLPAPQAADQSGGGAHQPGGGDLQVLGAAGGHGGAGEEQEAGQGAAGEGGTPAPPTVKPLPAP